MISRIGVGLVLLTVATRLPALVHPRAIDDENVYSVLAIEILEGGRPYVNAVERKPPGLFWTYAAIHGLVGRYNITGLHWAAVLWVLLTMAGLWATARTLFGPSAGFCAALLYCIYQPWLNARNLALNGEVLMNLPIAWAVFLTMRPSRSRARPELLAAGVLLCLAFLLKQPAAIAAVPLGVYLLLPSYRANRGVRTLDSLLHATWLTIGFFATLGLVALVLRAQGILGEAYYWTIGDHDLPYVAWRRAVGVTAAFVAFGAPMVGATILSLREIRARGSGVWFGRRPELIGLGLLLLASLIGAAAGGRFFPHYYNQLIPPLALLAAPVWARVFEGAVAVRFFSRRVILGWLGLSAAVFFVSHNTWLIPRRAMSDVARFLRAHSSPADRIFVWGQAAGLYLDAQRRPASRYITTFPLTGHIFGLPGDAPVSDTRDRIQPGAWETLEREFRAHPPQFIVDAEVVRRPIPRHPIQNYSFLRQVLVREFRLVTKGQAGWIYERAR